MLVSFACHRFPPAIIQRAVWLYVRFTLSIATSKLLCRLSMGWMSPTRRRGDGF
jgi:transposase-like protein